MSSKTYQVWYMRPEWFREGICYKKPNPHKLDATHIHLKDFEVKSPSSLTIREDLEVVWVGMQGEMWSPNGEARPLIEQKGLRHTSMSVGDCIVNPETGEVFLCKSVGFKSLGTTEPLDTDGDTSQWNENGEAEEAQNDRLASRSYRD